LPQARKCLIVRENEFFKIRENRVIEFNFELVKIDILKKSQGKLKFKNNG